MKITVTEEQRRELNSIIELLESDSYENRMLGFSLLESNFGFLKQYTIPYESIIHKSYSGDYPFSQFVKHKWSYAIKRFLQNILAGSDQFKLIV